MTVSTTGNRVQHNGNGSTVVFSFPKLFYETSHLVVTLTDTSTGVSTLQVEGAGSDYTVSGAGNAAGGTVTFNTAPATGKRITIERIVPKTQTSDYEEAGNFPANTNERDHDLLVMHVQEIEDALDRAFTIASTSSFSGNLIVPEAEAGKALVWNSAGDGLQNSASTLEDVTTVAGNIANIDAVAANTTNINAVATNATNINAVAGNATNINTVATNISSISAAVSALAPRKIDATAAPTANDDDSDTGGAGVNFEVGSQWIDVSADKEYVCVDASTGAAVWVETTQSPSDNQDIKDTAEAVNALGNISGVVSINYETAHIAHGTVTGNITDLTVTNWPASGKAGRMSVRLTQDGTGGRTITLGAAYETEDGEGVILSTAANAVDWLHLWTIDGGSTVYASLQTNWS